MVIMQLHVTVEEKPLNNMTGFEIKTVYACSSANLSPEVEKKNLIPENQSRPGIRISFDESVTSLLQFIYLTNVDTKLGYALDAADERKYCFHDDNCTTTGITFVILAINVLSGISPTFNKTLKKLVVLSDNRSFQAQGLHVAIKKLKQYLSILVFLKFFSMHERGVKKTED